MSFVVKKLAFGMTWCTATSDSRDEMTKEAKRLKANVYTEVSGEVGRMYGFTELKKWAGVRSAAAVLADSLTEGGIFIHRIGDQDKTCLIVIDAERHLPVLEMDQVGKRDEIIAAARRFIEQHPAYAGKVFGDVTDMEFRGAHAHTLERVANDAVISGELKPVTQVDKRMVLAVMTAIAATAVLFSEDLVALTTPSTETKVEPLEVQYKKQVTLAVSSVVQANQFPASVMGGFIRFLESVPGEAAGWSIESLKCVSTDCVAVWKRKPGATSEGFLRALNIQANDPSVTFYDVDYAKRTLVFRKDESAKQLILVPNSTFSEIVGSWLQGLSDRQLERPSLSPLLPLVPDNGASLKAGERPLVGTYQFTVPFLANDLQEVANLPEMLTIEQIELTRGAGRETKSHIKFSGKYYAL
jgi:hypothetical protein